MLEDIVKIEENARETVGIRVNGTYYHVDCVDLDDTGDLYQVFAYQLDENNCYIGYVFETQDLINATVQVYKLERI